MAGNIIYITFNEDLPVGSNLYLSGSYSNGINPPTSLQPNWDWIEQRNEAYKVTTGTPTATAGERSAINFMQAFQLDYAVNGQHSITRNLNVVTITSLYGSVAGYTWDGGYAFKPNTGGGFPISANVVFAFSLNNNTTPFGLSVEYLQHNSFLERCGKIRVKVTSTINMASISSPVSETGINANTYTFNYPRGASGIIIATSQQSEPVTTNLAFQAPPLLSADNFTINIYNTPNGSTLIITDENQDGLIIEYALSPPNTSPANGAFQSSNIFSGIAQGNYRLTVRDQFGCSKYRDFSVQEAGVGTPYFYISKAMSIRYAYRVAWGDAANYKNDENTLSCEANVKLPYKEIQQFQTADVITTQFRSNYANNTAKIIKADGTEIAIPVIQKTNNIGVKDSRDAIKINAGNGKTGIYFMSGNTYDYDTGIETGTYALNGALPYWGVAGNFIRLDSVWFQIDGTYYDETINAEVILIDVEYTGMPDPVIVSSLYNLFSYEIYEFEIDFVDYQNERLQVEIYCFDDTLGDVRLLSEVIHVKVRHAETVEIKYRNSTNTDVFYSTGITNLIRQPINIYAGVPDETSENYKTDATTVLLESEVYEVTQFTFEPVTLEIMRKMVQAFNHDTLQLDGVYYVKSAPCEVEGPLEKTNLYVVKASLIKTAGAFNSTLTGSGNEVFDSTNDEIPGLIDLGDDNFIRFN